MKRILLLSILFVGLITGIGGQPNEFIAANPKCGTYDYMQYLKRNNPLIPGDEVFENWLAQKIQFLRNAGPNGLSVAYQLPVVFHIIHNGEAKGSGRNVDSTLIASQLIQLNKDFANRSGSTYGVAANTEIQFCLAQKNPAGVALTEPGVHRVNRNDTMGLIAPPWTYRYIDSVLKKTTIWDPKKYINIWVVDIQGTLLGVSTFPGMSGLLGLNDNETDTTAGVVVRFNTVGGSLNPNPGVAGCDAYATGLGRTLSHELGHFFGLKHIWGDANCGTDYCGDTPTHLTSNSGKPTHPKPNNCPTADEMFENFMDYTDDDIVNTFTEDQKSRMQAVMMSSPRRIELAGSSAGCGGFFPSNKIGFNVCGQQSVKEGDSLAPCIRFKDHKFAMIVEDKASATATISFNIQGNARLGRDFLIIPSTLDIVTGDSYKPFVIRVYDDAFEEIIGEIMNITYNINGSGVVAGNVNQTLSVVIQDDDVMQIGSKPDTLLYEDFGTMGALPSRFATHHYSGNNKWGFGTNGGTAGASAYITHEAGVANPAGTYDKLSASASILYVPNIQSAYTRKHKLSFDWRCAGDKDMGINFDYGLLLYGAVNNPQKLKRLAGSLLFIDHAGAAVNYVADIPQPTGSTFFSVGWYWVNDTISGTDPGFTIDNVLVTGQRVKVETQAVQGSSQKVMGGETTVFYSTNDSDIVCKFSNLAFNDSIGCVTANVSTAGNGKLPFTNANGDMYFRSQKVFTIIPAKANTNSNYTLQLYFTFDEVNIWGDEKHNLSVMRVKDGAPIDGPFNSNNAFVSGSLVSSDSVQNWISYAGSFTGFSRFVLVSPDTYIPFVPLPVTFLEFTALVAGENAQLKWKVTNMENVAGFIVEKSKDGRIFDSMYYLVAGNYTATDIKEYHVTDMEVYGGKSYYYRIKQLAKDGSKQYSQVRMVTMPAPNNKWTLLPNPASNRLTVHIDQSIRVSAISIINNLGQIIKNVNPVTLTNGKINLDISNISAGNYQLLLHTSTTRMAKSFVKQ